ncbi:hypothetical protein R1flu_029078 [Riccia fluitans]|uniref:Endoglucanase n=1 Tax=Riccia fluitans TaxID=41844 RepID=A0ABD1XNH1_9MARC
MEKRIQHILSESNPETLGCKTYAPLQPSLPPNSAGLPRIRYSNVALLLVYIMASALVLFFYFTSVSSVGLGSTEYLTYRHHIDCRDYKDALSKTFLFYEAQRSGKLPESQRVKWRNDSGLRDGQSVHVDLSGGYHDAGDNVKFGFPLAYSITLLAWSVVEYSEFLEKAEELQHARDAIRWGTDYLLKAHTGPFELWVQVGDANADHMCWERPEDMDTPRTAYKVDKEHPGSDVAAETAAALAASSLVFQASDPDYSKRLIESAVQLFEFADTYRGRYSDSVPAACPFYCSYSGYNDELLWGATWLYKATNKDTYLYYILDGAADFGGYRSYSTSTWTLDWDNKFAGAQILLAQMYMTGNRNFRQQKNWADKFMCSTLPDLPTTEITLTPGGLLYTKPASNFQYVTSTAYLLSVYAKYLRTIRSHLYCGSIPVSPYQLTGFAKQQVDYILGTNPSNMSYMIGFGKKFPKRIHHRASSIPSVQAHPANISCRDGWTFFAETTGNPNQLTGALVGGPDIFDVYQDARWNFEQSEPTNYINAPLVGLLAELYGINEVHCKILKDEETGEQAQVTIYVADESLSNT